MRVNDIKKLPQHKIFLKKSVDLVAMSGYFAVVLLGKS